MYTYTHTYNTHTYIFIHTQIYKYTHAYTCTCTYTHIYIYSYTHTYTYIVHTQENVKSRSGIRQYLKAKGPYCSYSHSHDRHLKGSTGQGNSMKTQGAPLGASRRPTRDDGENRRQEHTHLDLQAHSLFTICTTPEAPESCQPWDQGPGEGVSLFLGLSAFHVRAPRGLTELSTSP